MSKQSINLGTIANDGTGDSLRVAGSKVNANANEIYTAIGDGNNLYDINGQIATLQSTDVTQNSRLTSAESTLSSHGTRLTTAETNITNLQTAVNAASKISHSLNNTSSPSGYVWDLQNGIHNGNKTNTTFYLYRGFTYTFTNNSAYDILFVQKGTGATQESGIDGAPITLLITSTGILNYRALTGETITWSIPFNAATGNNYKYYNSVNGGMVGDIYIL